MNSLSIQKLSDSELLLKLKTSVSDERKQTALVLEFLKEVDRRRLYADSGCSSLWEYCLKHLGYTEASAYRRIASMRLLREIPDLKEDLLSGKQNLTSLSQAQRFFKTEEKFSGEKLSPDKKSEVLEKLEGKSSRECELELIRMSSTPMELSHPSKERTINEEFTEWKLLLDSELLEMLNRIQALRSHAEPSMNKIELLKFMAHEVLQKLDPQEHKTPTKAEKITSVPEVTLSQNKRVLIPAKKRRLVSVQARGVCQYVDPKNEKRCESRHFLEVDHIIPVALGGGNELSNLRLLCRGHNSRESVKIFGPLRISKEIEPAAPVTGRVSEPLDS